MKPLKPRDKVTQHMTRDGLTLDNQTTGESINISSREAEQDYSAAEPGGTAEKVLERVGDIRERSKAKMCIRDSEYTFQSLRLFLLGAIHRAFSPGCKFEVMLCLVGGQGAGKSTFFRLLAVKDEWLSLIHI